MGISDWSLVIQRVSPTTVQLWVGDFSYENHLPFSARVVILCRDELITSQVLVDWKKPFSYYSKGIFCLNVVNNLSPNTEYRVEFFIKFSEFETELLAGEGCFKTLPLQLPIEGEKPFVIALGSCFANQDDDGRVSKTYTALYDAGVDEVKPDITFLVGDQVYLDIGFASLIPFSNFIRRRIANRYAKNWQALAGVFTRGGTWMLPDDHEYWNDYPFNELPIFALKALKINSVKNVWQSAAQDGADNIQSASLIEIINIGDDMSICLCNARSTRFTEGFICSQGFDELIKWAQGLKTPGVLVIQQLLIDALSEGERNPPSYQRQYRLLLEALASSGNDVMVLSGDVHYGRVAKVALGNNGAHLIEVVSSPLSNLKGFLNGFGADVASHKPEYFPSLIEPSEKISRVEVEYWHEHKVAGLEGKYFSAHPKPRTKEHISTISFSKLAPNLLDVRVNAWLVREVGADGFPQKGYEAEFRCQLRAK